MYKDASAEVNGLLIKAQLLQDRKLWRDALGIYRQLLHQQVQTAEVWEGLMQTYLAMEDFENAWDTSLRWEKTLPFDSRVYFLRSMLLASQGEYGQARESIHQALTLQTDQPDYYCLYAELLLTSKSYKESWDVSRQGLAIDAEHVGCLKIQIAALSLLEYDYSSEAFHLLTLTPEDPMTHAIVGWVHLYAHRIKEAQYHFKTSLRIDPMVKSPRDGLLESIKANSVVYRFLMDCRDGNVNDDVARGLRLGWIIVCCVVFIIWVPKHVPREWQWLSSLNRVFAFLFAIPVALVSLLFLNLFLKPLSNAALLLHPFGKMCLEKREKRAALFSVGFCLVLIAYFLY
ncbi:hypothetical protein BWI97_20130 [Siphonobacter sp. BAB-5405]|uniref:tetratricopeptide repeat protein n=1 Tax=Siphonobacter sp. BAB-5405 TaxID=1864825 RepID=UPI000C80F361|nr:hypothetical protein [Siphonobacter sp. BAB-5405]PMD92403.1 hypothetical protein BWI97_20130 [Siphonobacter sp. BAB-5405]